MSAVPSPRRPAAISLRTLSTLPALPPRSATRPGSGDRCILDRRAPERARVGRSIIRNDRDVPNPAQVPVTQGELLFPPLITLSEAAIAVERHLEGLAAAGVPLAGNQKIADDIGHCRSTVRNAIERLIRMRRIDVESAPNRRRLFVRRINCWTEWGEIRPTQRYDANGKPVVLEDFVITSAMRDVRRVVTRLANNGSPMANNPTLAQLAGRGGRSSAMRALRRLVRVQVLLVETRGSHRRVQVVATGRWTDWGEARPGHVPFLHRERGTPAPVDTIRARKPDTKPLASVIPRSAIHYSPPLVITHAEECQYANWADGVRPGRTARFCGAPCEIRGSSYCGEHAAIIYPNRRRVPESRPESRVSKMVVAGTLAAAQIFATLAVGSDMPGDRVYSTEALFS